MTKQGLSDDEFFGPIEETLRAAPHLAGLAPSGYPRTGRYKVDKAKALAYEKERTRRFTHNINLALALHLATNEHAQSNARQFAGQMISELEEFAATFDGVPGVARVLDTLWTAGWDPDDPSTWSVISHCNIALAVKNRGATVHGFELATGMGNVTADIAFDLDGHKYLLDVEMWHAANGETPEQIRERAVHRAEEKAAKKFAALPADVEGIVSEVCFAIGATFNLIAEGHRELLETFKLARTPRCFGQLFMIMGVGGADRRATGYSFGDSETEVLPLLPPSGNRS